MKYTVKVSDRIYEVEIEDIRASPIIALVDGLRFEVLPERGSTPEIQAESVVSKPAITSVQLSSQVENKSELTAPLPGTVIEIFVKAGDQIESGQIVLVIEAMKMKNSIRSTRAGKVAEILVSPGQTVAHKQGLVKFE